MKVTEVGACLLRLHTSVYCATLFNRNKQQNFGKDGQLGTPENWSHKKLDDKSIARYKKVVGIVGIDDGHPNSKTLICTRCLQSEGQTSKPDS